MSVSAIKKIDEEKKDNFIGWKTGKKKYLKERAQEHGLSLSKLIDAYTAIGTTIDKYFEEGDELVLIKKNGREILIPIEQLFEHAK